MNTTAEIPRVDRVDGRTEQAWNDQVLATPVERPVARFWTYVEPAIVLGRAQRGARALPADPREVDALPRVDREAGGGAVLIGPWMLSLSVALPLTDPRVEGRAVAASYRWLGEAFVTALAELSITARALPPEQTAAAPPELAWACFAGLAPWEVVVGRRKLVGFAQRRTRHGVLLVAGALLATVPWARMADSFGRPRTEAAALAASTIDAEALLGAPLPAERLAAALAVHLPVGQASG